MRRYALAVASVLALAPGFAPAADTYTVDSVHSSVVFRVKHMNTSYAYGRFNDISGKFAIDESDPSASKFDFTIKTDSIDTAAPDRDKHLKNTDFFNAKQFPTISFKSKSVTSAGKGKYEVSGDMTMHGVTKPITVMIEHTGMGKDMRGGSISGIESVFTIKRSDFGMKGLIPAVADEVKVMLSSEGVKK